MQKIKAVKEKKETIPKFLVDVKKKAELHENLFNFFAQVVRQL